MIINLFNLPAVLLNSHHLSTINIHYPGFDGQPAAPEIKNTGTLSTHKNLSFVHYGALAALSAEELIADCSSESAKELGLSNSQSA